MKIRIQFGATNGKIREVRWYEDILKMHRALEFDGDVWEWLAYDKVQDGSDIEYSLIFGKCVPTMFLGLEIPSFETAFGWQYSMETKCECGANYDRHFPGIHSRWCPKAKET